MFGGDSMADNADERKKIIEASLLLDSGLFDDEPLIAAKTAIPAEQEAAIEEEVTEGSSDDAMDVGFSVAIDEKMSLSDTRKAQLEAIRYFLKSEPVPKDSEPRMKERLGVKEKPKVRVSRSSVVRRKGTGEVKADRPHPRSHERPKMTLELNRGLTSNRVRDKTRERTMAVREIKLRPRQAEKDRKQTSAENKRPMTRKSYMGFSRNEKVRKDKRQDLMSMDMGAVKSGMDMKLKMDMEPEGISEYFRR